MLSNYKNILIAAVLTAFPAFGGDVSLGYLSILADYPTSGLQELAINNVTGPGNCDSDYTACSNLNFVGWTLTVNYTSTTYATTQSVFSDGSGGYSDIGPGSSTVFDFDLCGGVNVNNSCTPATTITSVTFTGSVSPSSFCLYDSSVPGCNTSSPDTFFANPAFSLTWDSNSATGSPYVDENSITAQSPDITVTDASSASTPEPGSLSLLACLIPLAALFRKKLLPVAPALRNF